MKKATLNFSICSLLLSMNVFGQTNPVSIDITANPTAIVCASNAQFVTKINNLASTQFTLGIMLEIVDANGTILSSPAIQCNTPGGGGNSNRFNII